MRLMIVDDDYQIREGMRLGMEWEKLGIDEVFTCSNGIEALKSFEEKVPDIILVDVQMPGMTGLELTTKIRKIDTDVRVIFISAYSEFEYCRQALKLGADDYILKPIEITKLEETILRNINEIEKKRTESDQYMNALLEQEMRAVYKKGQNSGKKICELLKDRYPFITEGYYFSAVLSFDKKEMITMETQLIKEIEKELFKDNNGIILPQIDDKNIMLIKGSPSAFLALYQQTQIKNRMMNWNQTNSDQFGSITVGISQVHDMNHFLKGYEEALEAHDYKFYQGEGSVNIYPVFTAYEASKGAEEKWISRFQEILHGNDFGSVKKELEKLEETLRRERINPLISKGFIKRFFVELCKKENIAESVSDFEKVIDRNELLIKCLEDLEYYIYEYIWCGIHQKKALDQYSHTVKCAINFVNEHYNEPLTLSWVANEMGKSTNYLGATFKKEVGESFTEYLTVYRMEQAKKLLLNTNKKIKEVCEEVGYTDYIYFSRMFKQVHGCSASKIRHKE